MSDGFRQPVETAQRNQDDAEDLEQKLRLGQDERVGLFNGSIGLQKLISVLLVRHEFLQRRLISQPQHQVITRRRRHERE